MLKQTKIFSKNLIRALRLPFVSASILPFIFGSLIDRHGFSISKFSLGFIAVLCTHLSANLINDYADSKSKTDWQDMGFYKYFGGSKLIQEGIFSEKFYLRCAVFFAVLSACAMIMLSVIMKRVGLMAIFAGIIFMSWAYSTKPFQFSYRKLGEIVIFLLFGPALVMGGYFIQTGIFPDLKSFMLSLPFGFLTTAVLYANEVPDFLDDTKTGKLTMVTIFGHRQAYVFYYLLIFTAFIFIILNVMSGYINYFALVSLIFIFTAVKSARILKEYPEDKIRLVKSSMLTIAIQTIVSLILIIGIII